MDVLSISNQTFFAANPSNNLVESIVPNIDRSSAPLFHQLDSSSLFNNNLNWYHTDRKVLLDAKPDYLRNITKMYSSSNSSIKNQVKRLTKDGQNGQIAAKKRPKNVQHTALTIYIYGNTLSLVSLLLAFILMVSLIWRFRSLRCSRNYIHCNLISAFILSLCSWYLIYHCVKSQHNWGTTTSILKTAIANLSYKNINATIMPKALQNASNLPSFHDSLPHFDSYQNISTLIPHHFNATNTLTHTSSFNVAERTKLTVLNLTREKLKTHLMNRKPWKLVVANFAYYYFNTATYFWMLSEGIYLMQLIFKGFENRVYPLKIYVGIGWVLPGVAVFVIAAYLQLKNITDYKAYDYASSSYFAWPWFFSIALNFIIFITVICVVLRKCCSPIHGKENRCKGIFFLIPLLGIMQIFTMHRQNTFLANIIAPTLISLQGFLVSLYCCFLNNEIKEAVRTQYNIWKIGKSHRSSSNNSALLTPLSSISMVKDQTNPVCLLNSHKGSVDDGVDANGFMRNHAVLRHLQLLRKPSRDCQGIDTSFYFQRHRFSVSSQLTRLMNWFTGIMPQSTTRDKIPKFSILSSVSAQ